MNRYITLFLWITVYLAISFGLGQLSQGSIDSWYQGLEKPPLNPPNWIFPVMWTTLYILIATAGWKIWQSDTPLSLKYLFITYTLLNWSWTPVFFGLEQVAGALILITLLNITALIFIIKSWNVVRLSAVLMIPPLLWTLFASYLNGGIWWLNT